MRIMHYAFFCRTLVMAGVGAALSVVAQTNSSPDYARWFVTRKPQLLMEFPDPPASTPSLQQGEDSLSSLPTDADSRRQDFQVFYREHRDFDLVRRTDVPGTPLTRALSSIFEPEVFHLGRTAKVSCSLLTAINRKNPLCLLNHIILQVSW